MAERFFEMERYNIPDYQGTSVMNYADVLNCGDGTSDSGPQSR